IHKIVVHNLDNLDEDLILKKINIKEGHSFWDFNSSELSNDLKKIKGIKSFSFKMESNGILNIIITEEYPFMIWKYSNKIKYLNEEGEVLEFKKSDFKNLISLEGKLKKESLKKFNKILSTDTKLKKSILKVNFAENIGWKIFFKNKSCLFLPEERIDKLISVYKKIKGSKIYNNFKYFDMRILGRVYLNKENKCLSS
ncbi:MAG: cell division protein FtsQ/DivIB, partial [Pseudomonadota bacterium]|nr:cell division protein FtsQ/DivIB [Pseudomonadota bacterium]